jgi:hypothetical protein
MTTPLTYNVTQAAGRLGPIVTVDWLKSNVHRLPHLKSGKGTGRAGRIAFTEAHLAEILLILEQRPAEQPAPAGPGEFHSIASRAPRRAS